MKWTGPFEFILWHIGWMVTSLYVGVWHGLRIRGRENIPKKGPAIIAANHQSYADTTFIGTPGRTHVRYMTQDYLFRVPVLGFIIRTWGAFPVGSSASARGAFRSAIAVVDKGAIFGIFPEGGRGSSETELQPFQEGVGRIAVRTGAPITPVTIQGAVRSWKRGTRFPRPARVGVTFHPPIHPDPEGGRAESKRVIEEVRRTITGRLGPWGRAMVRIDRLLARPAPAPRLQEALVVGFFGWLFAVREGLAALPVFLALGLYALYLVADCFLYEPNRWMKILRDASPVLMLAALHPAVAASIPEMAGGTVPLIALLVPPGIQAIWSGQPRGLRWVLGVLLTYIAVATMLHVEWFGAPGWTAFALAFGFFHLGHTRYEPMLQVRWGMALAVALAAFLAGTVGLALYSGIAAFAAAVLLGGVTMILSRVLPSRSPSR